MPTRRKAKRTDGLQVWGRSVRGQIGSGTANAGRLDQTGLLNRRVMVELRAGYIGVSSRLSMLREAAGLAVNPDLCQTVSGSARQCRYVAREGGSGERE